MKSLTPTEHQEQVALFRWLALMANQDERYGMAYAVPNGGARHPVVAAKLKAEGVQPGVPDICLPVPSKGYHGLYLEMKRVGGKLSDNQKGWQVALRSYGYVAEVCYGAVEAIKMIKQYLGRG